MSYPVKPEDCDHPEGHRAVKTEQAELWPGYWQRRLVPNSDHCGKCGKDMPPPYGAVYAAD